MPDKIDSGQFYIQHTLYDLSGPSGYDVLPPPPTPPNFATNGDDPGFPPKDPDPTDPEPQDPLVGQVYWDFDVQDFFAWNGTDWVELNIGVGGDGTGLPAGLTLPPWFVLTTDDPSAGSNSVNISAAGGVLTIILSDLPTSDPGGGAVWLSPT